MEYPLEINVTALQERLKNQDDFVLIDCREHDEWEIGHIEQATLLPMSEITDRVDELRPNQNQDMVVYCHHGGRSLQVTHWLRRQGFERTSSLAGGIDTWSEQVDSSIPRY